MSIEQFGYSEPWPPQLRVIEGGLSDVDQPNDERVIEVDGKRYTQAEWLEVLGVGQGYSRYADRRAVDVNWLLLGGKTHIDTPEEARKLLEEYHDDTRYDQHDLQEYLASDEYAALKMRQAMPEGA